MTHSCLKIKIPAITTSEVTNVMGTTAICGDTITDDGNAKITATGVFRGFYPNHTTSNSKTIESVVEKQFAGNLSGLSGSTTWWSSSEYDPYNSYVYNISYNNSIIVRHLDLKNMGFTVRCLSDK